tara:strand:+ start:226 stop:432 length:207 start_codon:yes stop_codon:yes gene_type:complete
MAKTKVVQHGIKVDENHYSYIQAPDSAPPAANVESGEISFYLDEGGNKLKVSVRYSDGTAKSGELALT